MPVAESKPLLAALVNASGGDECSKRPAQVFRVPGGLNSGGVRAKTHPKDPTRKKRSPHPQPVRELKPWSGTFTSVDNLRTLLAPHWETPAAERKPKTEREPRTGEVPTITRFLGRYDFDACLKLFQDCRAYSTRDPDDNQWQAAHREKHLRTRHPMTYSRSPLNRYKTWETFAFAAGFEFGPAGRKLIDAAKL